MKKQPYEMTREEWNEEREKTKIKHGQKNLTKNSKNEEVARMQKLEFLRLDTLRSPFQIIERSLSSTISS